MGTIRNIFIAAAVALAVPAFAKDDAPPDGWLTTKAKLTLLTKGELKSRQVHVDANDGVVTLYGKVNDAVQKRSAEAAVRDIKGVRDVRNLLQVVPELTEKSVARKDDDIADQARKMLKEDPALKDAKLDIKSVDKGVVYLTGKVNTFSDHLRAVSDVDQIGGVRRVVSEIQGPEMYGETERNLTFDKETKVEPRNSTSDTRITTQVKMKLLGADDVPSMDINVDTYDGVVTLFGAVPTPLAKERAETAAANVPGVARVQNQLEVVNKAVKKEVAAKDEDIAKELKDRLGADARYKDLKIEVVNGSVRLTGTVMNAWEKLEALRIARFHRGVKAVHEEIMIKGHEKEERRF